MKQLYNYIVKTLYENMFNNTNSITVLFTTQNVLSKIKAM